MMPYRIFEKKLEASLYNTIRLGLIRIANPLILTFDSQKHIEYHLNNKKWTITNTVNDFILVEWKDFELQQRGLHDPVNCKVYAYHIMAGRLMGTALYEVEKYINHHLENSKSIERY